MPDLSSVQSQMRADWNARAQEDAYYYVAFGRRSQADDEFDSTAEEVVAGLLHELKRIPTSHPRSRRALEIGCGPGRLLKPMSAYFGEIHGVDVSDAMVARARERLAAIPHAHAHAGSGSDLAQFADASFAFVYSYAVFQHIPSRDVVFNYLREAVRVLEPGGLLRAQLNGLPKTAKTYDTWSGVRISGDEIRDFCREHGLLLLALEGLSTQYMWTTWLKPQPAKDFSSSTQIRIRRLTNAFSSEPVAPTAGRFASISAWVENLPPDADLLSLDLRVQDQPCTLTYLGRPESDSLRQLNAILPAGLATGLAPVELRLASAGISARATLRIVPAPPPVPRVLAATDGIDLMSEAVHTGSVKLQIEEFLHPDRIRVSLNGQPVRNLEHFCTDPMPPRHEVNFDLPDGTGPGVYQLDLRYDERRLPPLPLTVRGS